MHEPHLDLASSSANRQLLAIISGHNANVLSALTCTMQLVSGMPTVSPAKNQDGASNVAGLHANVSI